MANFTKFVAYLVTLILAWWMGLHNAYKLLLILQGIDLAMGVWVALKSHTFKSSIGRAGIRRKLATWGLVGAVYALQMHAGAFGGPPETPEGYGIAEWASMALAFMEFGSIVENARRLGVNVPPVVVVFLDKAKGVLGLTPRDGDEGQK